MSPLNLEVCVRCSLFEVSGSVLPGFRSPESRNREINSGFGVLLFFFFFGGGGEGGRELGCKGFRALVLEGWASHHHRHHHHHLLLLLLRLHLYLRLHLHVHLHHRCSRVVHLFTNEFSLLSAGARLSVDRSGE